MFLKSLCKRRRLEHLAAYLETPGGPEMWKPEIDLLKKLSEIMKPLKRLNNK